jgi:pilus assembly protein Flp/PilA
VSKISFHRDETGQDLVEYGLLAALIALAMVAALQMLSGTIGTIWTTITNRLSS